LLWLSLLLFADMEVLLKDMGLLAPTALDCNGLCDSALHAAHVAAFGNLTAVLDGDSTLSSGNCGGIDGLG
jgi:hypothetical protein